MNTKNYFTTIQRFFSSAGCFFKKRYLICFFILLIISTIAAGLVFFLFANNQQSASEQIIKIKTDYYENIINRFKDRDAKIEKGMEENYRDVFR